VHPHSESVRQLPEIDNALQNWDDVSALDNLQRATQVFEMMQSGGSLHIAAISLLAECYQHQGNYEKASHVLHTLETLVSESSDTSLCVSLARAKASWYQGDFDRSMACVKQSTENDAVDDSNLNKGCVLNAEGLVRLMNSPCRAEDGSSVVNVLKIASKITERDSRSSTRAALTSASAKGNLGIAIVVTRLGLQEVRTFISTL
jgi:ATP/maltotriose-dependent transcriptional regulator MalT